MSEASYYQSKKHVFTVGEFSSIISEVMSSELFMNVMVRGEITSKQEKKGNIYLTLIDSDENSNPLKGKAILKVIIFAWYDRSISEPYNVGDEVVVRGDMSYYAPFGSLSLNAKDLYQYGEGMELIKLKRLKDKLEKEGLFAQEKKKPLPKSVKKIAIITSASGAAYHDIMETLSRKIPVSTVLYDALVQGEQAPKSLIKALDKAYKSDCDLIIFGRGGGSKTDLSCFNDEDLVRKVAASSKCIITGIGHEIDTSLCDLAGDIYAITPTQAADMALPNMEDVLDNLEDLSKTLDRIVSNKLINYSLELSKGEQLLESYSPTRFFLAKQEKIFSLVSKLSNAFSRYIIIKENYLKDVQIRLERTNPSLLLKEGTALVRFNNKPLKSVNDVLDGDKIEIGLKDGVLGAIIKKGE